MAPPLAGGEFMAGWDGLTIGDLFERIRISMPQNAPGSLSGQQNADILAFMFSANKFPGRDRPSCPRKPASSNRSSSKLKNPSVRPSLEIQKNGAPSPDAPFLCAVVCGSLETSPRRDKLVATPDSPS